MRSRSFLLSAGVLVLLVAAASFVVLWSQRGPGLWKEADRLASIMDLRQGMTGGEIGAGSGRMAVRVAQHLGSSGRLYATEIDAGKLQAIRHAASAAGLTNIAVVQAGEHATGLPDNCCDFIYMRRVYHHISDTANTDRSIYATLRPGGRLVIIDFISPRWMFFLHHGIRSDLLAGQVAAAGFILERRIDGWSPIDYCLIFRKI
jgi:ubiquinone/menaquinone biosynthesis C-methylase UbiE